MIRKDTIQTFLIFLTFTALMIVMVPIVAKAQQCGIVSEEIINLREPLYRTPMVWGSNYGHDGMDEIIDMVEAYTADKEEDGIIIAGNYTKDKTDKILHPFIARLDHRGKMVWETRSGSSTDHPIKKLIKASDGYAVLGDITSSKGQGIYLGRYAKSGKRIGQYPFYATGYKVIAKSLVETKDKNGFLIAAVRTGKKNDEQRDAVLYRINKSGTIIWQRKYSPGMKTEFNNIQSMKDGGYMLSGEIAQEDGRMAGWLMQVDESGAIGGQYQFPRGSASSLSNVVFLKDQSMIVSGTVEPLTGTKKSGWVMKLSSSGTPIWQRYYSGPYRYEAQQIIVEVDGRISVLLNAHALPRSQEPAERPKGHARLLTLSPRGNMINVESYSDGFHSYGLQLIKDSRGRRVVAGSIQGNMMDGVGEGGDIGSTLDGWAFAATMLPPYNDPCMTMGY